MEIKKFKSKLNCAMVVLLGLTLTFNFAQAVVLEGSGNNVSRMTSNILNWGLGVIFLLSFPIFIIGIYKLYKEKKKGKEKFKVVSIIFRIVLSLVLSVLFFIFYGVVLLLIFSTINNYISFIPSKILEIIALAFYIFGMYFYIKWLLKFTKLNFLIILSILSIVISQLIYYSIVFNV